MVARQATRETDVTVFHADVLQRQTWLEQINEIRQAKGLVVVFVGEQPEGSRDDNSSSRMEVLQAPVQQCAGSSRCSRISPSTTVSKRPVTGRAVDEVPMYQSCAGAHLIRFLGQQFASEVKGVRVDLDTGNVQAPTREQQLQYAFAAPHVQHTRAARLVGHPVDSTAENVAGGAPVQYAEVHLSDLIPHMFMCGRLSIIRIYHVPLTTPHLRFLSRSADQAGSGHCPTQPPVPPVRTR